MNGVHLNKLVLKDRLLKANGKPELTIKLLTVVQIKHLVSSVNATSKKGKMIFPWHLAHTKEICSPKVS